MPEFSQAGELSHADPQTANTQIRARVKELEGTKDDYREELEGYKEAHVQIVRDRKRLEATCAYLASKLAEVDAARLVLERQLGELLLLVGTETPIAAFDLATTWRAEKQGYMERQLGEARKTIGLEWLHVLDTLIEDTQLSLDAGVRVEMKPFVTGDPFFVGKMAALTYLKTLAEEDIARVSSIGAGSCLTPLEETQSAEARAAAWDEELRLQKMAGIR